MEGGGGEGGRAKKNPISFSLVTSTKVEVSHTNTNFLTFTFNLFATLVWNFKAMTRASPKLLNWNQDHSTKKAVFLVNSS